MKICGPLELSNLSFVVKEFLVASERQDRKMYEDELEGHMTTELLLVV
jgi:hypothetical protein